MNTQERKNIFFSFYDQLKPEHAEKAKANYDPEFTKHHGSPETHADAIHDGFAWHKSPEDEDYWLDLFNDLGNGTYPLQMTPRSCKAAAKSAMHGGTRMATQEDYEELENIAPPTEPNFGTKDTNPKDSLGTKKVPLSGMPAPVLLECGLVKLHGDLKYLSLIHI